VTATAATGGVARGATGAFRTGKSAVTLVAHLGKQPGDLFPFAFGTSDLFFAEYQNLEILVTSLTVIFKNGHFSSPFGKSLRF
jgi:hypothetical protein